MNKMIFVLLLCSGLLGATLSCFCKQDRPFWVMKSATPVLVDKNLTNLFSDTIDTDTLFIRIQVESIFTARQDYFIAPIFVSQANAFQCPDPGEGGLKSKLMACRITSSAALNQFLPGDDISSICSINDAPVSEYLSTISLPNAEIIVTINEKPSQTELRNIRVQFVFENNNVIEGTTSEVVWK